MEHTYNSGYHNGCKQAEGFTYCETTFSIFLDEAKQILEEKNQSAYSKGFAQGTIDVITERFQKAIKEKVAMWKQLLKQEVERK